VFTYFDCHSFSPPPLPSDPVNRRLPQSAAATDALHRQRKELQCPENIGRKRGVLRRFRSQPDVCRMQDDILLLPVDISTWFTGSMLPSVLAVAGCSYMPQPFTAPTVIPRMKYFCTNGYRNTIGPMATTVMASLKLSDGLSITSRSSSEPAILCR